MNTILKKLSAVGLSAVLTAGMLAGCGAKDEPVKLDGSKVVTTVDDELTVQRSLQRSTMRKYSSVS